MGASEEKKTSSLTSIKEFAAPICAEEGYGFCHAKLPAVGSNTK
jgi:hypothetical protein